MEFRTAPNQAGHVTWQQWNGLFYEYKKKNPKT